MFVILQPQTKQKSLFSEVGKDFNKESSLNYWSNTK